MNPRQPLWMPQGSVRAVLALLIIVPVTVVAVRSNITFSADQLIGLASLVLTAYFVSKAAARGGE